MSTSTIRRRLRAAGMTSRRPNRGPILTHRRRQLGLEFPRTHVRWSRDMWNSVLFTDESRSCLDQPDGRIRVWRRTGERHAQCYVIAGDRWGGASVMAWGGISEDNQTPLVCIDGTLNVQRYIDNIMQPVVLPFLQQHDLIILPASTSREYLNNVNVDVMPCRAYSPDISPIAHLWDIMKARLDKRENKPQNCAELIAAVQEEWEAAPQMQIQRGFAL